MKKSDLFALVKFCDLYLFPIFVVLENKTYILKVYQLRNIFGQKRFLFQFVYYEKKLVIITIYDHYL